MKLDTRYRRSVLTAYKAARCTGLNAMNALNLARYEARYEDKQGEHEIELPFGFSIIIKRECDDEGHISWSDHDYVRDYPSRNLSREFENWIVHEDRGRLLYYDWKCELRDISADFTSRQKALECVRKHYERARTWYAELWCYLGVVVTLYQGDKEIAQESVWGIDSDDEITLVHTAREIAADMLREVHRKFFAERGDGWKQYELALEAA